MFDEAKTVLISATVECAAAIVTSDRFLDRSDAVDDPQAIRANVGIVAFHLAAFKREVVTGAFSRNAEILACDLPFPAMGFDPAAATALVGDEVGEFVLKGPPNFFGLALVEFWVELDQAGGPPRSAGSRLHPRVPSHSYFAGKFVKSERF